MDTSLSPPQTEQGEAPKPQPKIPIPPPINVSNIKNFNLLREQVLSMVDNPIQFKAISNNDIKISTQNENDYRNIKQRLNDLKGEESNDSQSPFYRMEYHTYQLKSERWYRIVIRGLPSSMAHNDIKQELENKGHIVTNIVNIYKKTIVNGERIIKDFPLFYVDLAPKENNKEAFEIKDLLHCKVNIEPPRKVNGIPQCTNCQQLGHTKNFCNRQAKCVKCAGNHHTKECKKQRNSTPTCVLCGQKGHPASYRGCEVYQKKMKGQQSKKVSVVQRLQEKPRKQHETVKPINTELTYAQVTKKGKQNKNIQQNTVNNEPTIYDMMKMLSEFQTEIKQNLSQIAERLGKLENNSKTPNNTQKKKKKIND